MKLVGHEDKRICAGKEPAQLWVREVTTDKICCSPWMDPKIWWTMETSRLLQVWIS